MNYLNSLLFEGNIKWVYNEEGSGAKYWSSSAYYPDDLDDPKSNSGVTIDPGIDLGSGNRMVIDDVLIKYLMEKYLTDRQYMLLRSAIGLRRQSAIDWIKCYRKEFKNKFLVPDEYALKMLDEYSAPAYWNPLLKKMPLLAHIDHHGIKAAVHTALLSMAYNRGMGKVTELAKNYIIAEDYKGLADKVKNVYHLSAALRGRRRREAALIEMALEAGKCLFALAEVNPRPLTTMPHELQHFFNMDFVPVPEKGEI